MFDLGSRPSSDVAQQICSQLRPRSSRRLTSCGFSPNPASTAFQSNALTSGSTEVLDTIFVGLYRRLRRAPLQRSRRRRVQRRNGPYRRLDERRLERGWQKGRSDVFPRRRVPFSDYNQCMASPLFAAPITRFELHSVASCSFGTREDNQGAT